MPTAPVVAAAAPITQQTNSNNKNGVSGKSYYQHITAIIFLPWSMELTS
jgi:hypothetical protein